MSSCFRVGPRRDSAVIVGNALFVVVVQGGVKIFPLAGQQVLVRADLRSRQAGSGVWNNLGALEPLLDMLNHKEESLQIQ